MLVSLVGLGIGLTISAAARTSEVAIALLPIVLLPMVILGGVMQPIHKMNSTVGQCANLAPSRWAFEALLTLESDERRRAPERPKFPTVFAAKPSENKAGKDDASEQKPDEKQKVEKDDKDDADNQRPDVAQHYFPKKDRLGYERCMAVLGIMFAGLVVCISTILRMRDVH